MLVGPNSTHFNIMWVIPENPKLTHFTMGRISATHEPPTDLYRMLVRFKSDFTIPNYNALK